MSEDTLSRHDEAFSRDNTISSSPKEPDNSFKKREEKRLKKITRFEIVMLVYASVFTIYLCAFFRITPLFLNPLVGYRALFVSSAGTFLLAMLIISSLMTGYIFYRTKGLALALINGILAPLAAFGLMLFLYIGVEQWMWRRKFERLSPEEQERIREEELSLDYKYSSRGP
jgi:hypothetical protein